MAGGGAVTTRRSAAVRAAAIAIATAAVLLILTAPRGEAQAGEHGEAGTGHWHPAIAAGRRYARRWQGEVAFAVIDGGSPR